MVPIIKRLSILLVLFGLLFGECKQEDPIGFCQLKTDSFSEGTTATTDYVYAEHRLTAQSTSAPGYTLTLDYHYNVDGMLNLADGNKNGTLGKITYDYGINKQLVQSRSIFGTDTVTTIYIYNEQGQVTKKIEAYVGAVFTDSVTVDYAYPDLATKNPSTTVETHGGTLPVTTIYQYDSKINPFRDMFPSIRSYNNVVRIEVDGSVTNIAYTYNELGYPVSAVWTTGETQSYSYTCE